MGRKFYKLRDIYDRRLFDHLVLYNLTLIISDSHLTASSIPYPVRAQLLNTLHLRLSSDTFIISPTSFAPTASLISDLLASMRMGAS